MIYPDSAVKVVGFNGDSAIVEIRWRRLVWPIVKDAAAHALNEGIWYHPLYWARLLFFAAKVIAKGQP